MSKSYVLSVWLALLVHTGAHGIHVCFVCILSLVSWFLLLFDAICVVSMHDPQDPEDAAGHLGSLWLHQGERGVNKIFMRISMKWLSWLSVCQWQTLYNSHVVRVCFLKVSVVYRILPVCCKFPRGCRCYVLYCQSLYILQLLVDPDQK